MPTKTGELVALAAKGDKNALAELYTTNFKSAYFPACGLLKNKQEALRTVIGCFAKAFANLSKLPKPDEFEDFIKQITVKKCIDIIKKQRGNPLSAEKPEVCRNEIGSGFEFLPIEVLNSKELTSAVMKTVNSMPDTQRICVYLCYYNGYSASAAAKLVSCTEDDVNWHLLAAREQIKNAVDSRLGKPTELSRMNGTSILSLVMELMKKELTVNSETVKKSFFMACEKSELFGVPPQKKTESAPAPVAAYAPPTYPESAYEQPAFMPEIPQVQRGRNEDPVQEEQKKSGGKTAIIIAVIAVLMIVAGVLAYWLATKDDPDSIFAPKETTTVSDSAAINEGMTIGSMMPITVQGNVQNLKAEVEDYDILLTFLDDVMRVTQSYDALSADAKETTYGILMNSVFTDEVYGNFFEKPTYEKKSGRDSEKKLDKNVTEYYIFPAENADWIMINVFNITPDHSMSSAWYYYKDGFYYVASIPADDDSRELSVVDAKENGDGSYILKIRCDLIYIGDAEPSRTTFFEVLAALRSYEGKKYWSFYKMTESKESEVSTTQAAVKNLTAGDADFDKLTDFMGILLKISSNYNSAAYGSTNDAYDIVLDVSFGSAVYCYFFDESTITVNHKDKDPLGKLSSNYSDGYIVFPADNVDWIIKNIFCTIPDRKVQSDHYYYYDGCYYKNIGDRGDYSRYFETVEKKKDSEGIYTIKLRYEAKLFEEDPAEYAGMLTVKAALRETDGKRYWSLYSMSNKELPLEEITENVPTTAKKSDGYMAAYNEFLHDYEFDASYGEHTFGFAYIDNNNVPELIISTGGYHAAAAEVLTYVNGKVVEVGYFGSWGSVIYVEKGSVIVEEYKGTGMHNVGVYKMNTDGTAENIFSSYTDKDYVELEEHSYKINGVEVSPEEYARLYEENYPKNTTVFYNDDGYALTPDNIDKYCK
ncbi:MAG: RNA polymerase sigma factor [Clostridia bacterium]|nr:RNA polymerase sigma factor [Clostridia bacterium]